MSVLELKQNIHALIDEMDDEIKLQKCFDDLKNNDDSWATLNAEQQKEILEILEECEDEANLIPHEVVMAKLERWIVK
jgi:hypothetical protein